MRHPIVLKQIKTDLTLFLLGIKRARPSLSKDGFMKSLLVSIILLSSIAASAVEKFEVIDQATSTKVTAVSRTWEKYFTPNMCYPDAITLKTKIHDKIILNDFILKALKKVSTDVDVLREVTLAKSELDISMLSDVIVVDIGLSTVTGEEKENDQFYKQLIRVFEKSDARLVFYVKTESKGGSTVLEGSAIAIIDLENDEITLLTAGDAFQSSGCE